MGLKQRVARIRDHLDPRTGDRGCEEAARGHRHQRVARSVDHEGRHREVREAAAQIGAELARLGIEERVVSVPDGADNTGSTLNTALAAALADLPHDRLAGVFVLSDGIAHDAVSAAPQAPVHLIETGTPGDWDRRLIIRNAPAYAILGETLSLTIRIEDEGAVPEALRDRPVQVGFALNGDDLRYATAPVGQDLMLDLTLDRGGLNVLRFQLPVEEGELTDRNNAGVVQINGIRDRLRVLLVSGEPHTGQRTWRNLLKSDPSVDLVHFTILRPPDRQDGVPVNELSLIAFPTRELFVEKINDFDLIIFDRYKHRPTTSIIATKAAIFAMVTARLVAMSGMPGIVNGTAALGAPSAPRTPASAGSSTSASTIARSSTISQPSTTPRKSGMRSAMRAWWPLTVVCAISQPNPTIIVSRPASHQRFHL